MASEINPLLAILSGNSGGPECSLRYSLNSKPLGGLSVPIRRANYTALADATYGITGLNWEVKAGLLLLFFVFVFFFLFGAHLPGNFFDQLGP